MKKIRKFLSLLLVTLLLMTAVPVGDFAGLDWSAFSLKASASEPHYHLYKSETKHNCQGFGEIEFTCSCGDSYTEEIARSEHEDNNYDGACDYCSGFFAGDYLYKFVEIDENYNCYYSEEPTESVVVFNYIGDSETIVIPTELDGYEVVGIGKEAFYTSPHIKEVTISSSVKIIDIFAFLGCIKLEKVVIESCEVIQTAAFGDCLSLKEVVLPDNIELIAPGAFMGCFSLEKMILPGSVDAVAAVAFDFSGVKDVYVNNYNTVFGDEWFGYRYDFSYEDDTTSMNYTDDELRRYYTEYCTLKYDCVEMMLNGATPEEIIASEPYQTYIGNDSLAEAYNIVYFYSYSPRIYYVDDSCTIYGYEGSTAHTYAIENGINFVAYDHEHSCTSEITTHPTCIAEGVRTYTCECGYTYTELIPFSVHIDADTDGICDVCGGNSIMQYGDFEYIALDADTAAIYAYYGTDEYVEIPSTIDGLETVSILQDVFMENRIVKEVVIPNTVTYIGESAFMNCVSLVKVDLPESLEVIGAGAFAYCIVLNDIVLPEGLESIGEYAFGCCASLESITIPSTVTEMGYGMFTMCIALRNSDIKANISALPGETFMYCYSLEEVTLSECIKEIGTGDFGYCMSLKELPYNDEMTRIAEQAFLLCNSNDSIVIKNPELEICESAIGYITSEEDGRILKRIAELEVEAVLSYVLGDEERLEEIEKEMIEYEELAQSIQPATDTYTIYGYTDSTAHTYAIENNINFVPLDGECPHEGGTATCKKKAVCTLCGEEYGELSDHTPSEFTQPATCNVPGYKITTCSVCGTDLGYETIPTEGHSMGDWYTVTEGDCTTDTVNRRDCSKCDFSEEETVKAKGHTPSDFIQNATCTVNGYKITTCSVCGADLGYETIPAKGHSMGDWYTVSEGDCTTDTVNKRDCSKCDFSEEETVKAKGHTPSEFIQDATCTVPGYKITTCSVCGADLGYETIPAEGHSMGDWYTVTEGDCTTDTVNRRDCSKCDFSEEETVKAEGHKFSDWNITKEATMLEKGSAERICTVCGEKEAMEIPPIEGKESVDNGTGVKVEHTDDSYGGKNIEVKVEADFTGSQYLTQSYGKYLSWNIKTYIDGVEVQPSAPVLVSIPLPADYNADMVAVYHVNSVTGKLEKIEPVIIEDGYIKFLASSFSVYMVVDESSVIENPAPDTPDEPDEPEICGCSCHKNIFMKFIYKILNAIKKIFGIAPCCACMK